MTEKEKKEYKIEDFVEMKDPRFPGIPIFIPKEFIYMNVTTLTDVEHMQCLEIS